MPSFEYVLAHKPVVCFEKGKRAHFLFGMLDYLTALEMVNMCSETIKFWDWCYFSIMFWHINQLCVGWLAQSV